MGLIIQSFPRTGSMHKLFLPCIFAEGQIQLMLTGWISFIMGNFNPVALAQMKKSS